MFCVAFLSFIEKAPEVKGVPFLVGWRLKAGQSRQQTKLEKERRRFHAGCRGSKVSLPEQFDLINLMINGD